MVDTKEDFMKLDPAEIFSDEMEAAIEKVDVETLEPVMAGNRSGRWCPEYHPRHYCGRRTCGHRNELLKITGGSVKPSHKKIKSEEKMKGHGSNCVSFFYI